jgi:flagellar FliL protein
MATAAIQNAQPAAKKKGGKLKKLILLVVILAAIGAGAAGGWYALGGFGGHGEEADADQPQLVVREGVSSSAAARAEARAHAGHPDPRVFQATYIPLEGNFTSNLSGGDAFVQIGIGLSTYYDERVSTAVERHSMALRSAILMTLSEADPVEIATPSGKTRLKETLKNAINNVLTNREGFGGIDDVYFTSFVTQ